MPNYVINKYRGLYKRAYELYEEKKYKEAIELLEVVCEKDGANFEANFYLAEIYYNGLAGDIDYQKAFNHYLYAASNNITDAVFMVAMAYYDGKGTYQDYNQAFAWYNNAVKSGSTKPYYYLGQIYKNGYAGEKNLPKAIMWFLKAAKLNDVAAQKECAICYEELDEYENAAIMYLAASKNDDLYSTEKIARYYTEGKYVPKSTSLSIKLYEKAEKLGSTIAKEKLAEIYEDAPKDENSKYAIDLYLEAAKDGNIDACNSLGRCYYYGIGVDPDEKQAYNWWLKASVGDNSSAMYSLAMLLSNPKSDQVEKDLVTAKNWLIRSAELGNKDAMYELAYYLENGIGFVEKNIEVAYRWYNLALENGNDKAKVALKRFRKNLFGKIIHHNSDIKDENQE